MMRAEAMGGKRYRASRAIPGGFHGRRHLRTPAGAHDHGVGQHPVLAPDDELPSDALRRRARRQEQFGRLLVNSGLTVAIVLGMSVNDVSGKAIANLGWKEIKLTGPVFCGDTLYAESEVLEKRESKSRPTQGIVTVHTRAFKQDGTPVMDFVRPR